LWDLILLTYLLSTLSYRPYMLIILQQIDPINQ